MDAQGVELPYTHTAAGIYCFLWMGSIKENLLEGVDAAKAHELRWVFVSECCQHNENDQK